MQGNAQQGVMVSQVVPQPYDPSYRGHYYSRASIVLGAIQIVLGVYCIVTFSIGIGFEMMSRKIGHGVWGGLIFLITGVFGLIAGRTKRRSRIIVFLVLSIVNALLASGMIIAGGLSMLFDSLTGGMCYKSYGDENCYRKRDIAHNFEYALIAGCFIEIIIALVSSGFGCQGVCPCCEPRASPSGGVIYYIPGGVPAGEMQQVIVIPSNGPSNGQSMMVVPGGGSSQGQPTIMAYQPQAMGSTSVHTYNQDQPLESKGPILV